MSKTLHESAEANLTLLKSTIERTVQPGASMFQLGLNIAHGEGLRQRHVALFALPVLGLLNQHKPMRMQCVKARHETDIMHVPLVELSPREIARFEQTIHVGSENESDELKWSTSPLALTLGQFLSVHGRAKTSIWFVRACSRYAIPSGAREAMNTRHRIYYPAHLHRE